MVFFSIYRVRGKSMEPYAYEGDFVWVRKFFAWEQPKKNDIVILQKPDNSSQLLCKRVACTLNNGYNIIGDNREESTDSRSFGVVQRVRILGKVICRTGLHSA